MPDATKQGYTFDESAPPLMKNVGRDIEAVPSSRLMKVMGVATWDAPVNVSDDHPWPSPGSHRELRTTFKLTRTLRWAIDPPIFHYAVEKDHSVTNKHGYTRTAETSMERALEVDAGGQVGLDALHLDASVKDALKITESTTEQWTEYTEETDSQKFEGNVTYVNWVLIDSLKLEKVAVGQYYSDDPRNPQGNPTTYDYPPTFLNCIVENWQDSLPN